MARETTHLWKEIQGWLDGLNWAPSQAALAARLGLKSRSVITDWKYGASRPTPEHLLRLAHEMELLGGPDTYRRLVYAVLADLGYDTRLMHPKHRATPDELRAREAQASSERALEDAKSRYLVQRNARGELRAVAIDPTGESATSAVEADEVARLARAKQQEAIDEMNRKKDEPSTSE